MCKMYEYRSCVTRSSKNEASDLSSELLTFLSPWNSHDHWCISCEVKSWKICMNIVDMFFNLILCGENLQVTHYPSLSYAMVFLEAPLGPKVLPWQSSRHSTLSALFETPQPSDLKNTDNNVLWSSLISRPMHAVLGHTSNFLSIFSLRTEDSRCWWRSMTVPVFGKNGYVV